MADYVILESSAKDNRASGYTYSTVPNTNNAAGTSWRTALTEWLTWTRGNTDALSPTLPGSVSQQKLNSGEIYEWFFDVEVDANETPANKRAAVEAAISAAESAELTRLQNLLRFWGFEGVV